MNYSLGNMLSAGKVLGPALNLQFATDQSLTARRGATPTFTRASVGTFVGSNGLIQSASINNARFESDGLLIEPQRTNLVTNHNISDAAWNVLTNGTKVSSNIVAPDGATTAPTFTETTGIGLHQVFLPSVLQVDPSVDYAISFYGRSLGSRNLFVNYEFGTLRNATFNLSTNTGLGAAGVSGLTVEAAANSFKRACCKATSAYGTVASARIFLGLTTAANLPATTYAGSISESGSFWGSQIELGSYTTSLILTTGAAATRSADVCTLTIPSNVSSILITYGDNTTSTVSVTPGGTYVLPTSVKKYKSIISL